MKIYFLSAKVPLTKSFSRLPSGALDKSAYPLVRNFTSHERDIETPEQFCDALKQHAANGHCLLKGQISKPLKNESRAGATNPLDETRWSCFDLDNVKGVDTVEMFVQQILPPAFRNVDYILQYSASAGVTEDVGLRAHLFFLHDRPFTPEAAKLFLTELNLKNAILQTQVELTAAGTALRWPLDRTVCQNDKIIYITPPTLGPGVTDRLGDGRRIELVVKERRYVDFNWATSDPPAAVEAAVQAKVTTIRKTLGLKAKTGKTRAMKSGDLLLSNPDTAVVTGEKRARGFVYLNINGGDSWGYYYNEEKPRYLNNFKGEPVVVLADFLPSYWAEIKDKLATPTVGDHPFAFRHLPTDTIWNGVYDPAANRITQLAPTAKQNLVDFFLQYERDPPEPLQDWTFEFNPTDPRLIDFEARYCNRFFPTEYMLDKNEATEIPPTIQKVLWSVVGGDQESYDHFLNWLATIFQTRTKIGTAWVLHGVQGTGKGVLYHQILVPLFGLRHCVSKSISGIEEQFNADMEECIIFNVDEARVDDSLQAKRTVNKLKNMITEPVLAIRAMRANAVQARNYSNFIFTSNDYDALAIDPTDRRFNVAPRQETAIELSEAEVAAIKGELSQFAGFLRAYKADIHRARTALNNQAKRSMREASQDAVEQLCQAVTDGDLEYFMQFADLSAANSHNLVAWSSYRTTLRKWVENAGRDYIVRHSEIFSAYMFLIAPTTAPGPQKFARMLAHKNLPAKQLYRCPSTKEVARGYKVVWKADEEQLTLWHAALAEKQGQPSASDGNVTAWTPSKSLSA